MITTLLDWLVDYNFFTGCISVAMLIFLSFYMQKPRFEKLRYKRMIMIFACILVAALWFILLFGNYGHAYSPKETVISGNTLCFMDVHTSHYRGTTSKNIRMYIVDLNTGKKQFRNNIGSEGNILAVQEGLIFYDDYESYYVLDLATNKILKTYSWETLQADYPQTAPGISKIVFENMLMNVLSKNGNRFYIDPFSGKIADTVFSVSSDWPGEYWKNVTWVIITSDSSNVEKSIKFSAKEKSEASQLTLISGDDQEKDQEGKVFLYPEFIAAFGDAEVAVIKSYETTEKANFILTGISYIKMKRLWQIKQSQLESGKELEGCKKYNGNFIFNLGPVYYSINATTGVVNWETRL